MLKQQKKIIIIGAGLIGTSAAISLQSEPVDIEILEKDLDKVTQSAQKDTRPISLSYGSHLILVKLGIWDELKAHACPIKTVHVSEQGRFGCTHISAEEQQVPALGYVVPFKALQAAIYKKACDAKNITITPICSLNSIQTTDDHCSLDITANNEDRKKSADLLIAADGTHSSCRKMLGIATTTENNGDSALIFQLDLAKPHHHIAYERFSKMGVLAILPLHDSHKARLVWSITPRIEKKIATWSNEQKLTFLQDVFEGRLTITQAKQTAKFPLQTILAETQFVGNALLLGNSAHTIYPIAAQGFNLGLRDIASLADILSTALTKNDNIGSKTVLKHYAEAVKLHQEAIIKLTNQLTPLFELQLPFAGCARGLGLASLNVISPLKSRLAKRAMGTAGRLPKLLIKDIG